MIDLTNVKHHPAISEIVDVLCNKTQNTDRGFFQAEVAYFLGKVASCMRATLITKDRGNIPVNIYAIALGTSGFGKGHSVNIMETEFIAGFKKRFLTDTMPAIATDHLNDMAIAKSIKNGTDTQEEYDKLEAEYMRAGAYPFTFDSGTSPAVKQLRSKLLLASCGAINFQVDEIGSNLIGVTDVMNTFLELYDQGLVKQKLVKNTVDNIRSEDIDGKTPANFLGFGTPAKLLDGGITEDQFYSFLETGYARRCLFGMGKASKKAYHSMTPAEIFAKLTNPQNNSIVNKWATIFTDLADRNMFNWEIEVPDPVAIKLVEYRVTCEELAESFPEHEEIRKAELSHRYFKALKLAGAFAFIDKNMELTMEELMQAIKLVEESGIAFQALLQREKPYMKLAKYIASVNTEVTHADLTEALPFYKPSTRKELLDLAIAWGYKNNIIIKKHYGDGIEFFTGESLEETDINKLILSYNDENIYPQSYAYNYQPVEVPFDSLDLMIKNSTPVQWANHWFLENHRLEDNVIPKFNMLVLDIDEGIPLITVQDLFKDYSFITYTTKRHTKENNRFRLIIPINYVLEFSSEEYKEFMENIFKWLPFKTDEASSQRSKKWETYPNGEFFINHGKLLDVTMFIPKTSRNEQFQQKYSKIESMTNLERWFAQKISEGNRNNNMLKYALALVDGGLSYIDVEAQVLAFNKKLSSPLSENEIRKTILVTVAKRYENTN